MKLLILTQKVDKEDPILGFFHKWIEEFSKKFEKISVICLQKGEYSLPQNVSVYSLGKVASSVTRRRGGKMIEKLKYTKNFFNLILGLHKDYDAVFVHMNQEYVILGWKFWKLWRKKIFMWRNHSKGNFLTDISVWVSDKVFCTSPDAYTAKFKKTKIMPVGVDTNKFIKLESYKVRKLENSILSLGRISPVKNVHIMVEAAEILKKKGVDFIFNIVGDATNSEDVEYKRKLEKTTAVNFLPAVPNDKTPEIYNTHEIFINLTPSGSFDKTILESAACGCIPIIANSSLRGEIDDNLILENTTSQALAQKIQFWLDVDENKKQETLKKLQKYVLEKHSLDILIDKLTKEIQK